MCCRIFALLLLINVTLLPIDAYTVKCGHVTGAFTLNCRLADVADNTTLTENFPQPLEHLAPYVSHISISKSLVATLPSDIFNLFENLEWLTVHAGLRNLAQRQLHHATKLITLKLGLNNHLTHLESSLFSNVSTLEYIDLAYNDIADIGENVFGGLSKLQFLYLEGNNITKLKNNTFVGASKLQVLELSRNEISEIEVDAFSGLAELKVLMLNRNHITILQSSIFHSLKHLKRVDLSLNQIAKIDEGVFEGMNHLELIELGFNNITVLSQAVFNGATNLEKLYVSWNRLTNIDELFNDLVHLKILDLSFNDLSYINASVLSNRTKLEQLELRATGLTKLPIELFEQQTELQLLDLSLNNLSLSDENFPPFAPLHKLEVLKLENTSLIGISDELKKIMPSLKFINLAANTMDCPSVHVLIDFFMKNNIEYDFGETIDVECTLLPYGSPAIQAYDLSHSKFLHVKEVLGPDYVDPLPPRPFPPPNSDIPPDGLPENAEDEFIPEKIGQQLFSFDLNPQSLPFLPTNDTERGSNQADDKSHSTVSTTTISSVQVQMLNDSNATHADLQSKTIYLFNIGKILSEFTNNTINTPMTNMQNHNTAQSVNILLIASNNKTSNDTQTQADIQMKSVYLFNNAKIISDFGNSDDLDEYNESTETIDSIAKLGNISFNSFTPTINKNNVADSEAPANKVVHEISTMSSDHTEAVLTDHSNETEVNINNNMTEQIADNSNSTPESNTKLGVKKHTSSEKGNEAQPQNPSLTNKVSDVISYRATAVKNGTVNNENYIPNEIASISTINRPNANNAAHEHIQIQAKDYNILQNERVSPNISDRNQSWTISEMRKKTVNRGKIRYQPSSIVISNIQIQNNRISRKNSQLRNRGKIKYQDIRLQTDE